MKKKTICFDIDGVICVTKKSNYKKSTPIKKNIKTLFMNSTEAESYAKQVVVADFEEPGDDDVLRKVFEDLKQKGHSVAEAEIRAQMEKLIGDATAQLASE